MQVPAYAPAELGTQFDEYSGVVWESMNPLAMCATESLEWLLISIVSFDESKSEQADQEYCSRDIDPNVCSIFQPEATGVKSRRVTDIRNL